MEKPILFKGEMVNAILSGQKTQTRRICNFKGAPKWNIGNKLWVRESFSLSNVSFHLRDKTFSIDPIWYWADGTPTFGDWSKPKPSIHMPRWACRLILEIVSVGICKLHPISEQDAKAEGVNSAEEFKDLWIRINGQKSWDENPDVYKIEFERIEN